MAADPLLGEVGWSWLTEALDARVPGYAVPSGTVTRVITEGFGAKQDEVPLTGFELRASWSPAGPDRPARLRRSRRSRRPRPVGAHRGLVRLPVGGGRARTAGNTGAAATGARVTAGTERPHGGLPDGRAPASTERPRGGLPDGRAPAAALRGRRDSPAARASRRPAAGRHDGRRAGRGYRQASRGHGARRGRRRARLGLPLRAARLPGPASPGRSGHGAHRPDRLPRPVRRRRGAGRTPRRCCTRRPRTCPAWPRSASGRGGCSTPNWPGGCSATRGSASARWSRRCSASTWRRATRRPTGRPVRCPRNWLRYAALDVEVLVELRDALADELDRPGQDRVGPAGIRGGARRPPAAGPGRSVAAHVRHPPRAVPPRPGRRA